jgi:hypothetical protein
MQKKHLHPFDQFDHIQKVIVQGDVLCSRHLEFYFPANRVKVAA